LGLRAWTREAFAAAGGGAARFGATGLRVGFGSALFVWFFDFVSCAANAFTTQGDRSMAARTLTVTSHLKATAANPADWWIARWIIY